MKNTLPTNKAFSLIELLIVVSIIVILGGIVYVKGDDVRQANYIKELIHFDNSVQVELQEYLIAGYSFEEGSSGIASGKTRTHDGFGYNGTIYSNPSWTEGVMGNALDFSGNASFVYLGDVNFPENEITVSAFVKPMGSMTSAYSGILTEQYGQNPGSGIHDGNVEFELYFNAPNNRYCVGVHGPWSNLCEPANSGGNIGEWTHLIGSYDGTTLRLYKNGVEVAQNTINRTLAEGTNGWSIGRRHDNFGSATHSWNGVIDEVKIYSKGYVQQ